MAQNGLEDLPVDTIMTRWPETARVFLDRRMGCVGCPVGGFHTMADVARAYDLSAEDLESDIARVIAVQSSQH
jgi:hybrid cluster-associated redox disulfide protein